MNVLACVDFDGSTADVVGAAADLAAATGGELIVAHVSAPEPDFVGYDDHILTSDDQARAREQVRERLCAELTAVGGGVASARVEVVAGPTCESILSLADEHDAGIIALGRRHHSRLHDVILGSNARDVVRASERPVLLVPVTSRED